MKNFFGKKSVAVTITLVVIAIAIVIGAMTGSRGASPEPVSTASGASESSAKSWAKKNYEQYEAFLADDAGLFDSGEVKDFAKYDAQLDYTYGSILGVQTVSSLNGASMQDAAISYSEKLQLGDSDMLLLIDNDTEQWYLAYGNDMADYVNNDLSILFRDELGDLFDGKAG